MSVSSLLTLSLLLLLGSAESDGIGTAAAIIRTHFQGVTRMVRDESSSRASEAVNLILQNSGLKLFLCYGTCLPAHNYSYHYFNNLAIVVDAEQDFARILNETCPKRHFQPDKVLILILNSECGRPCIAKVALECWRSQFVRVLILSSGSDEIYTYVPFSDAKRCDIPKLKNVDEHEIKNALSRKIFNLNNCTLQVAGFSIPPRFDKKRQGEVYDGTEANVLTSLAAVHNFTVEYVLDANKQVGVIRKLSAGNVSFGISAMQLSEERYSSFSFVEYFIIKVVCVLPPPGPMPPWLKLIKPFDVYLWSALLASLAALLLMDSCADWLRLRLHSGLNVCYQFGALVGCTVPFTEETFYSRYALTLLLFFFFIIRSAFQASLINYLMGDYYLKSFDSMEEVFASRTLVGGVDLYQTVFGDESKFNLVPRDSFRDRLQDVIDGERFAMITSNIELYDHLYLRNGTFKNVHILKESLGMAMRGAFFPKLSAVYEAFGRTVLNIRAAGLLYKWLDDDYRSLSSQRQGDSYVVITMDHLLSAFIVLQFGIGLGALAFFIELLTNYIQIHRTQD